MGGRLAVREKFGKFFAVNINRNVNYVTKIFLNVFKCRERHLYNTIFSKTQLHCSNINKDTPVSPNCLELGK